MKNLTHLSGRWWPANQEDSSIFEPEMKILAIENSRCNRCGAQVTGILPDRTKYCRECIGIGRICEGDWLIKIPEQTNFPHFVQSPLTWNGKLTEQQQKISDRLLKNFSKKKNTLVHAVTGAGKTEMLFQLIEKCLIEGKRACIATPRIDVVNELFPRFQEAFLGLKIGKYHGREFKEPEHEQLTICTTHQLLKFYRAFDLLIIDEVDSFPYADNAQLHFAAKNSVKIGGMRVYLTATPTSDLLAEEKQGKIEIIKLKRRFHGGLLPVPKEKIFFRPFLLKKKINKNLLKEIQQVVAKKHPLLLFVPRIEETELYLNALKNESIFKDLKIAAVHAADPKRLEKVALFRDRKLDILITTTILERGVTFKNVWVIIVAADDRIYSASSLVQIAGRVGRDKNDKNGLVLFCYHKYTKEIKYAIRQIKEMNQ